MISPDAVEDIGIFAEAADSVFPERSIVKLLYQMAWRSKTLFVMGILEVSEAVVATAKHGHYLAEGEVGYQKYRVF